MEKIVRRIARSGFNKLRDDGNGVCIFYAIKDGVCHLVSVIEYREPEKSSVNTENVGTSLRNVINFVHSKGFEKVRTLALVVTNDENNAKRLVGSIMPYWIVNRKLRVLTIPNNMPREFIGLADILTREEAVQYASQVGNGVWIKIRWYACAIIINVITFLLMESIGSCKNPNFLAEYGGLFWPYVKINGEFYRFFTCMFIHAGILHLFLNMWSLYNIGCGLKFHISDKQAIIVYIISGFGASVFSYISMVNSGKYVVSCGASGAIFGMLGAALCVAWKNYGTEKEIKVHYVLLSALVSLSIGFVTPNVDNVGHLGGLIVGFIVTAIMYKSPSQKVSDNISTH